MVRVPPFHNTKVFSHFSLLETSLILNPLNCLVSQTQLVITVVSVGVSMQGEAVTVGPGPQLRVKRMGFEMAADGTDSGQFSKQHRGLGC